MSQYLHSIACLGVVLGCLFIDIIVSVSDSRRGHLDTYAILCMDVFLCLCNGAMVVLQCCQHGLLRSCMSSDCSCLCVYAFVVDIPTDFSMVLGKFLGSVGIWPWLW